MKVLFLFDLCLRSKRNLDDNQATSLLERLFYVAGVVKVTLLQQHRMPLCIASFPNQQYYRGKLRTPPRAPCSPPRGFRWPSNDAICFIDAYGPGERKEKTSLYNAHEAGAIADAIHWLLQGGDVASNDVVVVSFYQRQAQEIRRLLRERNLRIRDVTSVDGYQGSEAPVVVISTVRCNVSGNLGFAGDARRLNVAMTRACKALLIFGSRWTLTAQDGLGTWTPFFQFFEVRGWIQSTRRIAPSQATLDVLQRPLPANRDATCSRVSHTTRCQDADAEKVSLDPPQHSRKHHYSSCMVIGADINVLLQDATNTAQALCRHGDYQRLLAYVLTLPARVHRWGETVEDVQELDRKQWSHLNALYRLNIPIDATNYIYYFCLCVLVRTSPAQHTHS